MKTRSPASMTGFFIIMALLTLTCPPFTGCSLAGEQGQHYSNEQIANAIYRAENSVKYPYGIKSIDTHGDKEYARKICLNTIRNNRVRFAKQTQYKDFLEFLGSRYCPPSAHSLNKHWVKNVRYFLCLQK